MRIPELTSRGVLLHRAKTGMSLRGTWLVTYNLNMRQIQVPCTNDSSRLYLSSTRAVRPGKNMPRHTEQGPKLVADNINRPQKTFGCQARRLASQHLSTIKGTRHTHNTPQTIDGTHLQLSTRAPSPEPAFATARCRQGSLHAHRLQRR